MSASENRRRCRVSVITIFLNEERFLGEAIDSVLDQTYADWELLLVDDGSHDESSAIARRYAARFPEKIRYLEHEDHRNCGMSASRNLGLSQAQGEFVAFIDADDVWLPHKLERQVGLLDAHPAAAMTYGRTEFWHSWTGQPDDQDKDYRLDLGVRPNTLATPPSLLLILLKNEDQFPAPSDILYRREVIDRVGGFHDEFKGMYEDVVLLTKICAEHPVFVADEHWFRYRQHEDSCVARAEAAGQIPAARLRLLTWIEGYLTTHGVNDPRVRKALKRELRPHRQPRVDAIIRSARRAGWRAQGAFWWLAGHLLPLRAYEWARRLSRSNS